MANKHAPTVRWYASNVPTCRSMSCPAAEAKRRWLPAPRSSWVMALGRWRSRA